MTTNELKHKVINKINKLEDDSLLIDLIRIIDNSTIDNEIHRLSENHKKAINTAIDEIENGDYLTNEQSNKEIDEWLKR
jgi:hypothetical protein